ncbi:MAG TPA: PVC-type heme-binding CxxCH protein [Opitutaceae bacterium]|nr:PVC-type heme-binding CxxCH protein [Opitutaceae bacterium]
MKPYPVVLLALSFATGLFAAEVPQNRNTYSQAYGETKNPVAVDPAKDLPRYPAVEPKDAIATWKVKPGFKLQLAANEPQVRDPIAICFDENGRMFVCEMIDYSERREETPHLGRISLLEDKDGDGVYETSRVFADDLPWPTGLIWANGGLFVGATPDIWRFEDRDGDGRAEVREKVFTGFGTGLPRINVQAMLNSFQWGQDNRVHVQSANGNRGKIKNLKRPEMAEEELASRDFWFDPRTYESGFEGGGAQYGMSFDDYGRKFGCSNSDHLQFFVYDERYAARNPYFQMPAARQSVAADGGAAEVFRLSPDEPWRIIRTRWRIGGVVKGPVEGGGRVSGYFTGATGTTVFRGDAYGPTFVNNTFTGDAGGQLIHRKQIFENGVSLTGKRPADEQGYEFAASNDTWVRIVNFANAPDGCLHVCDMYREVIEHPWSIPEEIKQHIDLNNGNDRGRIYRLVPADATWRRRGGVQLGRATTAELVATLEHPNGWHRDTASRLLYERQDKSAAPLLAQLGRASKSNVARHHALGVLDGLGALDQAAVTTALADADAHVRERAVVLAETLFARGQASVALAGKLAALASDAADRVRFQLAFTIETVLAAQPADGIAQPLAAAYVRLAERDYGDTWISAALLSGPPAVVNRVLFPALTRDVALAKRAAPFVARLIEIRAAAKPADGHGALIDFVARPGTSPLWLRALGDGLRRAGTSIEQADTGRKLAAVFAGAAATAADARANAAARLEAIELLGVASFAQSREALTASLGARQPEEIQVAAIKTIAHHAAPEVTTILLRGWAQYAPKAKEAALAALVAREDRARALLDAVQQGTIKAAELGAAQVQALAQHKTASIAARAKTVLAAVIPPSRAEVAAKFQPATAATGDAQRGKAHYVGRCSVCHRAGSEGMALGPDLITVKTKGRDALLTAILEPHKEVASQYIAYEVTTKDGNAYSGIIARDDATSLTLKIMGGAEVPLPRSNIKGSTSSGKSLMPEGLEAGLSVQDMADLLTFIEELK